MLFLVLRRQNTFVSAARKLQIKSCKSQFHNPTPCGNNGFVAQNKQFRSFIYTEIKLQPATSALIRGPDFSSFRHPYWHQWERKLKYNFIQRANVRRKTFLFIFLILQDRQPHLMRLKSNTRWFKYDRDWLCVNNSQFVPVVFEPPCTSRTHVYSERCEAKRHDNWKNKLKYTKFMHFV
jgi:hypothetical protein